MASCTTVFQYFLVLHFVFTIQADEESFTEILCDSSNKEPLKYVVIDTDMGVDDAWALHIILKAEKFCKNVKVLAITTAFGNSDVANVIKNTYRILDGFNRTDIPIYKGSPEAIIPTNKDNIKYFGENGFGDIDIWKPNYPHDYNAIVQKTNAIEFIRDLVMNHPHKITLLCLAPLTNIALAIKVYPEIQRNIKEIFIMGGSYTGKGNIIPTAEFNFYLDPESVFITLNSLIRPIIILPIDAYERGMTTKWRFDVLGKVDGPNVQLLNQIELLPYQNRTFYDIYDALAVAALLFPKIIIQKQNPFNAAMELHGNHHTRGEMFVNRQSTDYNVLIIEKVFNEEFKKLLLWAANYT